MKFTTIIFLILIVSELFISIEARKSSWWIFGGNKKKKANNRPNAWSSDYNKRTNPNDWGRGSVYYLDRHDMDCGANSALKGFHLTRPRDEQIAYEYKCESNQAIMQNTYQSQTNWNVIGNDDKSSTHYLDRHQVQCKDGYVLQQVKLIRSGNRIAYGFRCVQAYISGGAGRVLQLNKMEMQVCGINLLQVFIWIDRE